MDEQRCPVCEGATMRLFQKGEYWVRACDTCGHRLAEITPTDDHVARVYDDSYFCGGGAGYADYLSEGSILRAQGRRYGQTVCRHMAPGVVLDVGAAAGFILLGLQDCGWKGVGIEPNARMAAHARDQLGMQVQAGTLEAFHSSDRFDLVTMIQVMPHFVDPKRSIQIVAEYTKSGGYCLIETWNRASWTAWLFGSRWHEYSPPTVLHWFSPEGLERLMAAFGFHEVERGRPVKWLNGAHAKSLLRYKWNGSAWGRFMGRAVGIIPDWLHIPYPAEDLFWSLFKK